MLFTCPNCGLEVYVDDDGVIIEPCPFCGECEGDIAIES